MAGSPTEQVATGFPLVEMCRGARQWWTKASSRVLLTEGQPKGPASANLGAPANRVSSASETARALGFWELDTVGGGREGSHCLAGPGPTQGPPLFPTREDGQESRKVGVRVPVPRESRLKTRGASPYSGQAYEGKEAVIGPPWSATEAGRKGTTAREGTEGPRVCLCSMASLRHLATDEG